MEESILNSIKKLLGLTSDYTAFDTDIIIHINTVFVILFQMGMGNKAFSISDSTATWDDFLKDYNNLELVKSYMYAKVRQMFDPPSGAAQTSLENMISELEFRINIAVDPMNTFEFDEEESNG